LTARSPAPLASRGKRNRATAGLTAKLHNSSAKGPACLTAMARARSFANNPGGTLSPLSPWVFDCADASGSHCIDKDRQGEISCEGPMVGETKCDDGKDGDSDGKVDCDDEDCRCESQ